MRLFLSRISKLTNTEGYDVCHERQKWYLFIASWSNKCKIKGLKILPKCQWNVNYQNIDFNVLRFSILKNIIIVCAQFLFIWPVEYPNRSSFLFFIFFLYDNSVFFQYFTVLLTLRYQFFKCDRNWWKKTILFNYNIRIRHFTFHWENFQTEIYLLRFIVGEFIFTCKFRYSQCTLYKVKDKDITDLEW